MCDCVKHYGCSKPNTKLRARERVCNTVSRVLHSKAWHVNITNASGIMGWWRQIPEESWVKRKKSIEANQVESLLVIVWTWVFYWKIYHSKSGKNNILLTRWACSKKFVLPLQNKINIFASPCHIASIFSSYKLVISTKGKSRACSRSLHVFRWLKIWVPLFSDEEGEWWNGVTDIICMTQITFKLVNNTLLVNTGGFTPRALTFTQIFIYRKTCHGLITRGLINR